VAISIEIDEQRDLTIFAATGIVGLQDIASASDAAWPDRPTTLSLWDLTAAVLQLPAGYGASEQLASNRARVTGARMRLTAVVAAAGTATYGSVRQYEILAGQRRSGEVRSFTDRDAALAWLLDGH
jgi:hypothetical protein